MSWLQVDNRRDLRRYAIGGIGADAAPAAPTAPIVAPAAPAPAMNPVLAWLNAKRQVESFKALSSPKPAVIPPVAVPLPAPAPAPAPVEAPRRRGGMGMETGVVVAGLMGLLGGVVLYQAFGRRR